MLQFGTQAAMGLSFLYLTVILTLGGIAPLLQGARLQDSPAWQAFSRGLAGIGMHLIRHRWTTVTVFLVIAGLALWRARGVEINSSTLETYDESNEVIQNLRLLENRLSGLLPMEISLKADSPDLFYRPDIYRKVAQLQQFAMEQKPVLFHGRTSIISTRSIDTLWRRGTRAGPMRTARMRTTRA